MPPTRARRSASSSSATPSSASGPSTSSPVRSATSSTSWSSSPTPTTAADDETMRQAVAGIEAELRQRLGELEAQASCSRPSGSGCAPSTTWRCWPRRGCAAGSRTTAGTSTAASRARRPSPSSTSSPRTSWWSWTRATWPCPSSGASTPATGRGRRPWSTTGSACPRPSTTGPSGSRSSSSAPARPSCCRPHRARGSSSTAPTWSNRSSGRPGWSTPRWTSGPPPGRSTTSGSGSTPPWPPATGCWSPP